MKRAIIQTTGGRFAAVPVTEDLPDLLGTVTDGDIQNTILFLYKNCPRLSYEDHLEPGQRLMCLDDTNAEGFVLAGGTYHFSRWMNQDTLGLVETQGQFGKVGLDPSRFTKMEPPFDRDVPVLGKNDLEWGEYAID